jgi:4-hydroxybenzoate-CoA ligase
MSEEMPRTHGNAGVYFVDRHANGPFRDKAAFLEADGGRKLSYAELARESGRMAALFQRHGIAPENRIALLALDRIEFPILFWGALKAGVIPVPLNTLLSADIYEAILLDSRARAIFVSKELLPALSPLISRLPDLDKVFVLGEAEGPGLLSFAEELAKSEPQPALAVSADECAFWLYSSGSTGRPKGVRHVHGSLKSTADTYGADVLQIRPDDIVYSAAKMFFAYGLGNSMTFPQSVGATTLLFAGRPTPVSALDILNRFRPTIFCGVPTLYAAMTAELESGRAKVAASLRRCISAGEALPADVGRRWEKLAGCEILDGVGSTEMLHIFLSNRSGEVEYGASGVAVPGYDIRLVDEAGREVGVGEIGELLVRGDSAASDYWNQRERSRSTFEGAWTRTGDKYERTASGRLVYCGRTDDMFKVGGIWVSPFEVEQALISHPAVLEAAVVAARDENGLEKPRAFVVLKPGADDAGLLESLQDHVKARVGKWKYPRWVEILTDLPKTATGKIQRFKLRE